jgi:HemY protein
MIRAFIFSLLALAIGAWLYQFLGADPGYVLVSFGSWSVETTLVAMVLFLLLVAVLVWGITKLVTLLNPLGLFRGDAWFGAGRRRKHAAAGSEEGLRLLLLGHWQNAYKLLVENADRTDAPAFNYLAARLAAWQRSDNASWNYCLEQAARHSHNPNPGIKAVKALLEYRSGKTEQSLAILLALDKEVPGSPYVLSLLKTIYQSVKDWEKLDALLPQLEKHKVITAEELLQLRETIAGHRLLSITAANGAATTLNSQWHALDKNIIRGEEITLIYLQKLLEFSQHDAALSQLSAFLKHQWSDRMVLLAGFIDTPEPGSLLVLLEKWMKSRPNNAPLMLSLGRVSLRNKLWGKAREYFESAQRFSNSTALSAEANAELARLLEHMGEHAQSASLYRKAMAQLDHKLPELPMPE